MLCRWELSHSGAGLFEHGQNRSMRKFRGSLRRPEPATSGPAVNWSSAPHAGSDHFPAFFGLARLLVSVYWNEWRKMHASADRITSLSKKSYSSGKNLF